MKKNIILVLLFCLGVQGFAQRKPKIKGNRNVTESTENLPRFTEIQLEDDIDVLIQKGSQESVTIEADDNLMDVLKFSVSDGTLYISSFYNITSKKKLNITVFYTELEALTLSNGLITMKDVITSEYLDVKASGASRLILNASADVINIQMEENSSGDFNVASDSLNLTFKDRIDAKVYATGQKNTLLMYKNASVKMEGNTAVFTAKLYGNSTLKAEEFKAVTMLLESEDSPDAKVYVMDEFKLSSKGTSKTSLYGNPKITILEFLDTSQLHKENNEEAN
ncbi:MAG: hypothetical protein ACJART_000727 [Maribacter sp.]|jgi:hypothetical protein